MPSFCQALLIFLISKTDSVHCKTRARAPGPGSRAGLTGRGHGPGPAFMHAKFFYIFFEPTGFLFISLRVDEGEL